jgi:hypothetical protein
MKIEDRKSMLGERLSRLSICKKREREERRRENANPELGFSHGLIESSELISHR